MQVECSLGLVLILHSWYFIPIGIIIILAIRPVEHLLADYGWELRPASGTFQLHAHPLNQALLVVPVPAWCLHVPKAWYLGDFLARLRGLSNRAILKDYEAHYTCLFFDRRDTGTLGVFSRALGYLR
jgi:hypothetical protein